MSPCPPYDRRPWAPVYQCAVRTCLRQHARKIVSVSKHDAIHADTDSRVRSKFGENGEEEIYRTTKKTRHFPFVSDTARWSHCSDSVEIFKVNRSSVSQVLCFVQNDPVSEELHSKICPSTEHHCNIGVTTIRHITTTAR